MTTRLRFLAALARATLVALGPLSIAPAVAAEVSRVSTVAGVFTGTCEKGRQSLEGKYVYRLGRSQIRSLTGDCTPGAAVHYVNFNRVWRSRGRTSVMALQGDTGYLQLVRLFQFRSGLPPLVVQLYGSDPKSITQIGPGRFVIVLPSRGFHMMDRVRAWECRYDINFNLRAVSSALVSPHGRGVRPEVCAARVRQLQVG